MKKQINPTIKAHLIRSSFYVLLLLAVCVIPFTLAQRNAGKQSAAQRTGLAPSASRSVLAQKPAANSSGKSTSAAGSALAQKSASNLSGKSTSAAASAALASKSTVRDSSVKAADAATSAGLAPGTQSIQFHKSPRHLTGTILWYNGDFNGVNGLANEENTSLGSGQFASVYDDFNVPAGGWSVGAVFSDNLANTTVTG